MSIEFIKGKRGTNTKVVFNGKEYMSIVHFENAHGFREGSINQLVFNKKISHADAAIELLSSINTNIEQFIYKMKPVYSRFINA